MQFGVIPPPRKQAQAVVEELSGILHCILNTKAFDPAAARDSVLLLLGSLQVCDIYMCVSLCAHMNTYIYTYIKHTYMYVHI